MFPAGIADEITTGVYFNDILFTTALNFDYSELHTPFAELTRDTHIRLARALVQELPTNPEGEEKANMLTALDLCDRAKLDQCLDQEDQIEALKSLSTAALLGINDERMEAYLDENFLNADLEAIKENREAFLEQLYHSIFSSKQFITQLNGAPLGKILSPIHNMARGMAINDKKEWNRIQNVGYQTFSLKVQGEINRQIVHDALILRDDAVQEEFSWLKEWILNEASNEDIKHFLRFVSGSTGLPNGKKINVDRHFEGKHPIGHTCYYEIQLSGKNTNKESFIEHLKEALLVIDFGIV